MPFRVAYNSMNVMCLKNTLLQTLGLAWLTADVRNRMASAGCSRCGSPWGVFTRSPAFESL